MGDRDRMKDMHTSCMRAALGLVLALCCGLRTTHGVPLLRERASPCELIEAAINASGWRPGNDEGCTLGQRNASATLRAQVQAGNVDCGPHCSPWTNCGSDSDLGRVVDMKMQSHTQKGMELSFQLTVHTDSTLGCAGVRTSIDYMWCGAWNHVWAGSADLCQESGIKCPLHGDFTYNGNATIHCNVPPGLYRVGVKVVSGLMWNEVACVQQNLKVSS